MEWSKLLIPYRLGCPKSDHSFSNPNRGEFQRDFDRVIFSSPFRRLNGKTQIFPFPDTDLIHTRLTHSLETASVGRSLGTIVENKSSYKEIKDTKLGAIVCVACLAHDIGNPPLGHSGEKAISEFFKSNHGRTIIGDLTSEEQADFQRFDGNAMGFHVLTYSNPKKEESLGGLRLTYPTLAAFLKYPRPAKINNKSIGISEHKPGIFQSDLKHFSEIAQGLNLTEKKETNMWFRHPLAFLTEAADDICYTIMDFEDGYKRGLFSFKKASEFLKGICDTTLHEKEDISKIKNIKDKREKIGFLRAKAINSLIYQVTDIFLSKEKEILEAKFDKSLFENIETKDVVDKIRNFSKKNIYTDKSVIQVEAAGFQVLPGLLGAFLDAIKNNKKESSKKILQLLPNEYQFNYKTQKYEAILAITMYVSGMTDHYAVDTYRYLQGIQLPNY